MKTTVAIEKEDNEFLTELAKKRGVSKAELMKLLVTVAKTVGASEDGEVAVTEDGVSHDLGEVTEEVEAADDNFHPLVVAGGDSRDRDEILPEVVPNRCLACERGGARRGAPHTCGKPNPHFSQRPMYG